MSNQRRHERYTINREFESIGELIDEYVTNISRSGVFIRSRNPLPVGTEVDLNFTVVFDGFRTIAGRGTVMRVVAVGADAGMGVAFTALDDESLAVIDQVIAHQGE